MPPKKPALPAHIRRHGSGFRTCLRRNGRRRYGPTYRTVEEAVAYRDKHQALQQAASLSEPVLTVQSAIKLLEADLSETGARPDTVDYYEKYTRRLAVEWGTETPLHAITHAALRHYLKIRESKVSVRTLWCKEYGVIRRLFRLAIAKKRLHVDPTVGLRAPRKMRKSRFHFLEEADVLAIVDCIAAWPDAPTAQHAADVVLLLFTTGVRLAEMGRLKVRDYRESAHAATLSVDGKTDNREQPVSVNCRAAVARLIAGKEPDAPLVSVTGKRRHVSSMLEHWKRRLELPHFSAHVLRHSFATAHVRRGVNIFDLQVLMGHASITQTARYFHASSPLLQRAADALASPTPALASSPGTTAPEPGPAAGKARLRVVR